MAIRYDGIEFDTIDELLDYKRRAGETAPLSVKETRPKAVKKSRRREETLEFIMHLSKLPSIEERLAFIKEEAERTGKASESLRSRMYKLIRAGKLGMHTIEPQKKAQSPPVVKNHIKKNYKRYSTKDRLRIQEVLRQDGDTLILSHLKALAEELQKPYTALRWQAWSILKAEKRRQAKTLSEDKPEPQIDLEVDVKPGIPMREPLPKYMTRRRPLLPEDFIKKRIAIANKGVTEEIPEWSDIYPLTHESQKPLIDLVRFTIGSKGRISYRDLQFTTTLVGEKVWSGREWHGFIEQFMHQGKRILAYFGAKGKFLVEIEHGFEYIKYEGERK